MASANNSEDYYSILGVPKTATLDEITKAYHKLALKYHPDKTQKNDSRFKIISKAYSNLSSLLSNNRTMRQSSRYTTNTHNRTSRSSKPSKPRRVRTLNNNIPLEIHEDEKEQLKNSMIYISGTWENILDSKVLFPEELKGFLQFQYTEVFTKLEMTSPENNERYVSAIYRTDNGKGFIELNRGTISKEILTAQLINFDNIKVYNTKSKKFYIPEQYIKEAYANFIITNNNIIEYTIEKGTTIISFKLEKHGEHIYLIKPIKGLFSSGVKRELITDNLRVQQKHNSSSEHNNNNEWVEVSMPGGNRIQKSKYRNKINYKITNKTTHKTKYNSYSKSSKFSK